MTRETLSESPVSSGDPLANEVCGTFPTCGRPDGQRHVENVPDANNASVPVASDSVAAGVPAGGATEQLGRELARKMRRRWRNGERPLAEEFMNQHPDLQHCSEAAIDLIYEEYCLRHTEGDAAVEQDILLRFPQWAGPLRVMLDCHRALQSDRDLPRMPAVGETVGGFRLLSELGRGSRGQVYLATQTALADRPVVLKITPLDGSEHVSLARVQHTNIVPLHSVIDDAARSIRILCMPYFGRATLASLRPNVVGSRLPQSRHDGSGCSAGPTSELCLLVPLAARTGQYIVDTIDSELQQSSSPVATAGAARQMLAHVSYVQAMCWITACLADALEFAHERGLVHLDLKPSNVLLATDGQPMLLDFHLAREPVRPGGTLPDNFGGTPGYMPPEQQAAIQSLQNGRPGDITVDGRADIYALGAMLYESLGGRLPIEADSPPLAHLNPQVSVGLSDIVAKCLARRRVDRYNGAAALADDLRRHLTDQPLVGVPNRSHAERWHKWRRRRPNMLRAASMLAVVAAAAVILAAGTWLQLSDRREQADRALRDGLSQLERGRHYAEAVPTFERGLAVAESLPFQRGLELQLRDRLNIARRLHVAQQLHELADEIRALYGTDSILPTRLRTLASHCRAFWEKRSLIVDLLNGEQGSEVAADLLDVAVLTAQIQTKLSDGSGSTEARHEALRVLDEAEAMFGPSAVLEHERRVQRRALGLAGTSEPLIPDTRLALPASRTAWEHAALGRAYLMSGHIPQAAEELSAALELDPAGCWTNFYFGLYAYRIGRYDEAVAAFSVCIGAAPNVAGCFHNRALALAAIGHTDLAMRDYDQALTIDPGHAAAALNRAMLYYEQGQLDKAVSGLYFALQQGADPATVHYDLALVHMVAGDPVAVEDVARALQIDPNHELARKLRDTMRTPRTIPAP